MCKYIVLVVSGTKHQMESRPIMWVESDKRCWRRPVTQRTSTCRKEPWPPVIGPGLVQAWPGGCRELHYSPCRCPVVASSAEQLLWSQRLLTWVMGEGRPAPLELGWKLFGSGHSNPSIRTQQLTLGITILLTSLYSWNTYCTDLQTCIDAYCCISCWRY